MTRWSPAVAAPVLVTAAVLAWHDGSNYPLYVDYVIAKQGSESQDGRGINLRGDVCHLALSALDLPDNYGRPKR